MASGPSIKRVLLSVLVAFFGVQTERNRVDDFSSEKVWPYVVGALVMALLFILLVWALVMGALYLSDL